MTRIQLEIARQMLELSCFQRNTVQISTQVIGALGGDYAAIADRLSTYSPLITVMSLIGHLERRDMLGEFVADVLPRLRELDGLEP